MERKLMQDGRKAGERGQAMVEFVILLIVFMALISGQLYAYRLLLYDFWAQQEARFLAFEQTEVTEALYNDPAAEAVAKLSVGGDFNRPATVSGLDVDRGVVNNGSVRELLLSSNSPGSSFPGLRKSEAPPVMIASALRSLANTPSIFVEPAYASKRDSGIKEAGGLFPLEPEENQRAAVIRPPKNELEQRVVNLVKKGEIGGKFCKAAAYRAEKAGFGKLAYMMSAEGCADWIDTGYGIHLAETTDVKQAFLDYGYMIEDGFTPQQAFEAELQAVAARGFYSFFDVTVRIAAISAAPAVIAERGVTAVELGGDQQFQTLMSSLRYMGSIVAAGAISLASLQISVMNVFNTDPDVEQNFADALNGILHADASQTMAGVGYMLDFNYLPFNSIMLNPMYGSIINGVMTNVLSEDDDLKPKLITDSNKRVQVTYEAGKGLFPSATRRFNTSGKALTSRFYLVTQPWHIPRRVSPDGEYREVGGEDDSLGTNTDEGTLKRRIVGLWLFPSNPVALLSPVADLLGAGLGNLFDGSAALEGFGAPIEMFSEGVKDFICDNPLNDLLEVLDSLPIGPSGDFSFPACPAVRATAYPFTKELKDDKSTGSNRDFAKFLQEQKDNNPRARPKYHEDGDTATNGGGQDKQGAKACNWSD